MDAPSTARVAWLRAIPLVVLLAGGVALVLVLGSVAPSPSDAGPPHRAKHCAWFAAQDGSDRAKGTFNHPFRSVGRLIRRTRSGETGCLRKGDYGGLGQTEMSKPRVTLRSYPGEHATLRGRLWIQRTADGTTVTHLDLDGLNAAGLPSPTINADRAVLRHDNITNEHSSICISVGSPHTYGRSHGVVIEANRIHDCGRLPSTNQDHGIYVNSADRTVIRDNWIYRNADRGIQLYSDAQGTLVSGNVIYGNGEGVLFGGDSDSASSNNIVQRNIITNSTDRDNIDSYWQNAVGTGNVARTNCVGGGPLDDGDGGVKHGHPGFAISRLLIRIPAYANPAHANFTIPPKDPCAKLPGPAGEPLPGILDSPRR